MAKILTKIKLYCKANDISNIDFTKDVRLQDDGDSKGVYIKEWNLDIAQPTNEQLASYETAGNNEEALQVVLNNRKNDYPSIADQLDDIYHNGVDGWKETIKAVKDKYPKE
tara:strand:+ start:506 stop:838 length:333 start_codon:yes stop_codon:yes gene_type:complete